MAPCQLARQRLALPQLQSRSPVHLGVTDRVRTISHAMAAASSRSSGGGLNEPQQAGLRLNAPPTEDPRASGGRVRAQHASKANRAPKQAPRTVSANLLLAARARAPRFCHPRASSPTHAPAAAPPAPIRRLITAHNLSATVSAAGSLSLASFSSRPFTCGGGFSFPLSVSPTSPSPFVSGRAHFSTSRAAMGAQKIDGTAIAKRIRESLHAEIEAKKQANPRFVPCLKIIQGMCHLFDCQRSCMQQIHHSRE